MSNEKLDLLLHDYHDGRITLSEVCKQLGISEETFCQLYDGWFYEMLNPDGNDYGMSPDDWGDR